MSGGTAIKFLKQSHLTQFRAYKCARKSCKNNYSLYCNIRASVPFARFSFSRLNVNLYSRSVFRAEITRQFASWSVNDRIDNDEIISDLYATRDPIH